MSKTTNAIKQLHQALIATTNALELVSKVLDETESFYFELFRQREQLAASFDQDYVENWQRESELQQTSSDETAIESELFKIRQAMTDVMDKIYPTNTDL